MLTRKERVFDKSFVIKPNQLEALVEALCFNPNTVRIQVKCRDGSTLHPESTSELLALPNPASRAILKIRITGETTSGTKVELEMDDSEFHPLGYELSGLDADVVRVSRVIEDRYEPLMQGVSWLTVGKHASLSSLFTFLFGSALIGSQFDSRLGHHGLIRVMMIVTGAFLIVFGFFDDRLKRALFPIASFCIGDGRERFERSLSRRKNLLWVVFVGFLISVLAGIFANSFPH